jgi:hypothetical protein
MTNDASSPECLGNTRIGLVRKGRASSIVNPSISAGENWAGAPATPILSVANTVATLWIRRTTGFPEAEYRIGVVTESANEE